MLDHENAHKASAHARALKDVEGAPLAGLAVLAIGALVSALSPASGGVGWTIALALVLLVGPPCLARWMPRRNLAGFCFALAAYPLNGLLLAFIAYQEMRRMAPLVLDDYATLQAILPWSAPLLAGVYYLLQFYGWKERLLRLGPIRAALADPPEEAASQEVQELAQRVLTPETSGEIDCAQFRTVPATFRNWRLYLKLDPETHGTWHVAFSREYALVLFKDGGRMEEVKRGGLRIVAEDPKPGAKTLQCLVRWNGHLHEGRITPDNFYRIQAWNSAQ